MDKEKLQLLIDTAQTPEAWLSIAKAYMDGSVLRDPVAAEAWAYKALENGDSAVSADVMAFIAHRILRKEKILEDADLADIYARLPESEEEEKDFLQRLLRLTMNE